MSKYFVKFVKFNTNTIAALINKQVKFSTVYEFNDFNELSFLGVPNNLIDPETKEQIDKKMQDYEFQCQLVKQAKMSGCYTRQWIEQQLKINLKEYNKSKRQDELKDCWQFLMENVIFNTVGIFCISELCVFEDDSAELMFAHYADNLKGLALIYEVAENKNKVNYLNQRDSSTTDMTNKFKNHINGKFNDIEEFIRKSYKWGYEKEYRIFGIPKLHNAEDKGIKLKAILHTPRFPQEQIQILKRINTAFYKEKLECKEIYPSCTEYKFKLDKVNVCEWLLSNLCD